jgi:spore coat polysaccharide biosynthesis predicted glycosyltransferase SpsG
VCFGGSDSLNLTCKVVKFLIRFIWVEEINVLIGDAYNYKNELDELIRDSQIINLYQNLDSFGVIQLMQKSNFAVVPASTLLFETLAAKLPAITGYYVDNQKQFEKDISEINNVESVGDFVKMKYITFANRVNSLKKNYTFEIDCIDGRSGERLLNIFESL